MDQHTIVRAVQNHEDDMLETASNCEETNSEQESISEEERVRRLFAVCDADGDGYIDRSVINPSFILKLIYYMLVLLCSQDLISALQELGLEGAINVSDLMEQMGADTQGKVSYEQFLRCRLTHQSEIDALREQPIQPDPQLSGWINAKDLYGSIMSEIV